MVNSSTDTRRRPEGKLILLVDFDGCVNSYCSGWQGIDTITDPPVPGVFEWLETALIYFDVQIFSARSSDPQGREAMYDYVKHHAGRDSTLAMRLKFVSEKPSCFLTIDDRCIRFDGNWSDHRFDPVNLLEFKSWYQSKK